MPRFQWRGAVRLLNSRTGIHPLLVDLANTFPRRSVARLLSGQPARTYPRNCSLPGHTLTRSIRLAQRAVNSAKLSQTNYPVRQYGTKILINGYFRRRRPHSPQDRVLSVIVAVARRLANRSREWLGGSVSRESMRQSWSADRNRLAESGPRTPACPLCDGLLTCAAVNNSAARAGCKP